MTEYKNNAVEEAFFKVCSDLAAVSENATEHKGVNLTNAEKAALIDRLHKAIQAALPAMVQFSKNVGKLALTAALVSTLTACAGSVYDIPNGMPPAQWDKITAECTVEGNKIPTVLVPVTIAGSEFHSESCGKKGCTSYDTFTPPSVQMQDLNATRRDNVIRACFIRHRPKPT